MNPTIIFSAILCAVMLWATGSWAQKSNPCDPRYHFITPANCTTYGEQAAKAMAEMRVAIGEESAAIAAARKRFWETYPDKSGAAEARDEFGLDLAKSFFIGDKLIDLECGWNAGVQQSILVRTGYGWETEQKHAAQLHRAAVVDDLAAAAAWILNQN